MVHAFRSECRYKCVPMLALLLSLASMESRAQVAGDPSLDAGTQQASAPIPDVTPDPTSAPAPGSGPQAPAAPALPANRLEVYGYVMTDFGYNFETINPDWFDTMRPTKLPSFRDEFGRDGVTFAGVRQTRFGVKGFQPTKYGELQTIFEWELFGVGVDVGQTTFRLRHAYGELGHFGAGQTWSPFMDIDVFPNSIEYWGPNGMAFFRNVQVRWMPIQGDTRLTFALERPGSSQDPGRLQDRIEIANILARFPYPDASGEFRWGGKYGYVEAAGIIGQTRLDDVLNDRFNLNQTIDRWGIDLTSNIKVGAKDVIKLGYVFGEGMENYMNDAPADIAAIPNFGDPVRPIRGDALPFRGLTAFYDHYWSDRWSTSAGYSEVVIDNTSLQLAKEFHRGQYALANLLWYPAENVMAGGEFQWGRRTNFGDGFHFNDYKLQFSFRFNFKGVIGNNP
jgi:DcaP outer membrane protein